MVFNKERVVHIISVSNSTSNAKEQHWIIYSPARRNNYSGLMIGYNAWDWDNDLMFSPACGFCISPGLRSGEMFEEF